MKYIFFTTGEDLNERVKQLAEEKQELTIALIEDVEYPWEDQKKAIEEMYPDTSILEAIEAIKAMKKMSPEDYEIWGDKPETKEYLDASEKLGYKIIPLEETTESGDLGDIVAKTFPTVYMALKETAEKIAEKEKESNVLKEKITNHEGEIKKLNETIKLGEEERSKIKEELKKVLSE